MAWSAKRISVVAGALALTAELGLNNSLVMGFIYATVSGVAAPAIVKGVVAAHDKEVARLAADRQSYAEQQAGNTYKPAAHDAEPGDADQKAQQTDALAEDAPDMPRRIGPMIVARLAFLKTYENDPGSARTVLTALDKMLHDDDIAFKSFDHRAQRDIAWNVEHRSDLLELRAMDTRLKRLRDRIAA